MQILMLASAIVADEVVGLQRVVFRGVVVPPDAVAVAFVSFFVGFDLLDGLQSDYLRCSILDSLYGD